MNRGFNLKFENNLTISVQFGSSNYCDNRSFTAPFRKELKQEITECENAGIAIWDEKNKWFNFGSDTVKGHVTANEVADWIYKTKQATCIEDIVK